MKQAEKVDLTKEKYLLHCSYFFHHGGMSEPMKRLTISAEYQHGGITEHECFSCGKKEVYYYLPQMSKSEKTLYADLVQGALSEEEKEYAPCWRVEEDLYVLYLCHKCKMWFVDERWSDGH